MQRQHTEREEEEKKKTERPWEITALQRESLPLFAVKEDWIRTKQYRMTEETRGCMMRQSFKSSWASCMKHFLHTDMIWTISWFINVFLFPKCSKLKLKDLLHTDSGFGLWRVLGHKTVTRVSDVRNQIWNVSSCFTTVCSFFQPAELLDIRRLQVLICRISALSCNYLGVSLR